FPAAYMRSSTSTVNGRKSTSRRLPAVAVQRTMVSPERTTTAPEACLASLPVSNEISVPLISTDTRVTASDIFNSLLAPPFGRQSASFLFFVPNGEDGSGGAGVGGGGGWARCRQRGRRWRMRVRRHDKTQHSSRPSPRFGA